MSIIIRLQNLPWSANSIDIRRFFSGQSIPEGGVHIVGGEMGDAFIAFSTDEDARLAMAKDGGKIKDMQIKLLLSSRAEMMRVIEQARQQNMVIVSQPPIVPTQAPAMPLQQPARVTPAPSEPDRRRERSPVPRHRSRDRSVGRDRRRSPDDRRSSKRDRSRSPSRSSRSFSRDDRRSDRFKRDDRRYDDSRYRDENRRSSTRDPPASESKKYSDADHVNSKSQLHVTEGFRDTQHVYDAPQNIPMSSVYQYGSQQLQPQLQLPSAKSIADLYLHPPSDSASQPPLTDRSVPSKLMSAAPAVVQKHPLPSVYSQEPASFHTSQFTESSASVRESSVVDQQQNKTRRRSRFEPESVSQPNRPSFAAPEMVTKIPDIQNKSSEYSISRTLHTEYSDNRSMWHPGALNSTESTSWNEKLQPLSNPAVSASGDFLQVVPMDLDPPDNSTELETFIESAPSNMSTPYARINASPRKEDIKRDIQMRGPAMFNSDQNRLSVYHDNQKRNQFMHSDNQNRGPIGHDEDLNRRTLLHNEDVSRRPPIILNEDVNRRPPILNEDLNRRPLLHNEDVNRKPPMQNEELNRRPPLLSEDLNRRPPLHNEDLNRRPSVHNEDLNRRPPMHNEDLNRRHPMHNEELNRRPPMHNEDLNRRPPMHNEDLNRRPPMYNEELNRRPPMHNEDLNRRPMHNEDLDRRPPTRNEDLDRRPPMRNEDLDRRPPIHNEDLNRRPPMHNEDLNRRPPLLSEDLNRRLPMQNEDLNRRPLIHAEDLNRRPLMRNEDLNRRPLMHNEDVNRRPPMHDEDLNRGPLMHNEDVNRRPPMHNEDVNRRPPIHNEDVNRRPPMQNEDGNRRRTLYNEDLNRRPPIHSEEFNRRPLIYDDDHNRRLPMRDEDPNRRFPIRNEEPNRGSPMYNEGNSRGPLLRNEDPKRESPMRNDNQNAFSGRHPDNENRGSPMQSESHSRGPPMRSENKNRGLTMHSENQNKGPAMHNENQNRGLPVHSENQNKGPTMKSENQNRGPPVQVDIQNRESVMHGTRQNKGPIENQSRVPSSLTVEVKGLPPDAKIDDVLDLFKGISLPAANIRIEANDRGFEKAFIRFTSSTDFEEALNRNRRFISEGRCELVPCPAAAFDGARSQKNKPKVKPREEDLTVQLRGLPFSCKEDDIIKFFDGLAILDLFIEKSPDGKASGLGFVEFGSNKDFRTALAMNGKMISHRYITVSVGSKEMLSVCRSENLPKDAPLNEPQPDGSRPPLNPGRPLPLSLQNRPPAPPGRQTPSCIFMTGLPEGVTNRNIADFLNQMQIMPRAIHIMLRPDKMPSGDAYAEFLNPADMEASLELHGKTLSGNRVEIKPISFFEMSEILGRPVNLPHPEGGLLRTPSLERPRRPLLPQGPREPIFRERHPVEPPMRGVRPRMDSSGRPPFGSGRMRGPWSNNRPRQESRFPPPPSDRGPKDFGSPGCVVAINNLHFKAGLEEILEFFHGYNITKDNVIRKYNENGQTTGEARVAFQNPRDAQKVVRELNQKTIMGRSLSLSVL